MTTSRHLVFSLSIAATLLATASLSAAAAPGAHLLNRPAPQAAAPTRAADGTLGMALLGASVSAAGALLNGAGATGALQLGTGTYEVDFDRDVSGCFYSAVSYTNTVPVFSQPRAGNPNGVFIVFKSLGTTSASPVDTNSQFYLTVFCGQ